MSSSMSRPVYTSITEELQNIRLKQALNRLGPNTDSRVSIDMLPAQAQRDLYIERLGQAIMPATGKMGKPPTGTTIAGRPNVPSFNVGTGGYYKAAANVRQIKVDTGSGSKKIIFG